MARKTRANTLAERPSSSSGLHSGSALTKADFNKRVSRDDLALNSLAKSRNGSYTSYHIPIRGQLPTPDTSPRKGSLRKEILVRTESPESMKEQNESGVIAIGMALGSPNHPPQAIPGLWDSPASLPAEWTGTAPFTANAQMPATKSRKWGIFGRSRSKKVRDPELLPRRAMTDGNTGLSPMVYPSPVMPAVGGSNTNTQRAEEQRRITPKHKPLIVRSQTEPLLGTDTPKGALSRLEGVPEKTPAQFSKKEPPRKTKEEKPLPPRCQGMLLDVDIPSIEMERYSIMFGEVLRSQPASSLLARRQATLSRLKTISDETAQISSQRDQKKPAAPIPRARGRSPSFSLFPPTPGRSDNTPNFSPRMRSNTSPAFLPSPLRGNFQPPWMANQNPEAGVSLESLRLEESLRGSPAQGQSPQAPQLVSKYHKQGQVPPGRDSPASHTGERANDGRDRSQIHIKDKLRPDLREPAWQMMSPPTSVSSSGSLPFKDQSPSSAAQSPDLGHASPSEPVDPAEKALQDAVKVSIARQISVSQQQRRLLLPLQDATPRRRKDSNTNSTIAVGKDSRLAATKTSKPLVVHPGQPEPEVNKAPTSYHRYHKSEQVVLESA